MFVLGVLVAAGWASGMAPGVNAVLLLDWKSPSFHVVWGPRAEQASASHSKF